jgi:hypothetical protein
LPEIRFEQKLQMFQSRYEKSILNKMCKVDRNTIGNVQCVSEYAEEIHQSMRAGERFTLASAVYMKKQSDINESMRAILVDWLIDVHIKFKLLPETLYLTVNLIDRYLSIKQVKRTKLQLVGVAALMVATKYEEIYPPTVKDFVYITDNAYKKDDILQMESCILSTLDFNI